MSFVAYFHARRALALGNVVPSPGEPSAPVYPAVPLYFESYSGDNTSQKWQNLGTLSGYMYTADDQPGRQLSAESKPVYVTTSRADARPWQIPNVSAVPSDYTFYVLMRGSGIEDVAGVGGYLMTLAKGDGTRLTIFGYGNQAGSAEVGILYQFGRFQENAPAPRAPFGQWKIFAYRCQNGQPVQVYDEQNTLIGTSAINYEAIIINYADVTVSGGAGNNQVLGSSTDFNRIVGADFGGFAVDTKAHDATERAAVMAKWRADLNF